MPGLVHDLAFILAGLGGRGCEAGAQRVPAELFSREAGVANMAFDDQGNAGVGESAVGDLAVLSDRPEDGAGDDLRVVEPGPQQGDGTGCGLAPFGDTDLDAIGGLVGLRPAQVEDDPFGS